MSDGAATAEAATNQLAGGGSFSFSQVVAALQADLEHLVVMIRPNANGPSGSRSSVSRGRSDESVLRPSCGARRGDH